MILNLFVISFYIFSVLPSSCRIYYVVLWYTAQLGHSWMMKPRASIQLLSYQCNKTWALLADEATSFNPFALLSTTYVLLHGRSWMMKPHASILLPIPLESFRSSTELSISFEMQLECIYVSCLHRWTSTLRSTWIRSPSRIPCMKSSNTCDLSSCAWKWHWYTILPESCHCFYPVTVLSVRLWCPVDYLCLNILLTMTIIEINMNNIFYKVLYHSWIFWIIIIASSLFRFTFP